MRTAQADLVRASLLLVPAPKNTGRPLASDVRR